MSPRLGAAASEPPPNSTHQVKIVDGTLQRQGLSDLSPPHDATDWRAIWLRPTPARAVIAEAGFLGSRERRESLWASVSRSDIERGHDLAEIANAEAFPALSETERAAAEARLVEQEQADLDEENSSPRHVLDLLPAELAAFLRKMPPARRREREQAILDRVGWEGLNLIELDPLAMSVAADSRARRYAERHPEDDARFQTAEHRKLRLAKTWRRRLTKQARKARCYIESAVGAVGGPERPGRPLYVSDYGMRCYRAEVRQSLDRMRDLRIVNVADPSIQIGMLDAHQRKKAKEMAKRRLLLDVHVTRAEAIGARTIWTTLTLPGRFHPHASNEDRRAEQWNPDLGPDEAMAEIQKLYHQTMCLLREQRARPWGFWDAQAQQDGTPHRHFPAFVHDRAMTEEEAAALADPDTPVAEAERIRAASETRVLAEARAVADRFWTRFSSVPLAERQKESRREDHGCSAYVIGDTDPRYAPPRGRDGNAETCASIMKYTARYSTRMATGMTDIHEADSEAGQDAPVTDLERHAAWATARRARLHNWVGMDSQRSPGRIWDCVWKAAERGELPVDARLALAVEHMIDTQRLLGEIIGIRAEIALAQQEADGDDDEATLKHLKAQAKGMSAEAAWSAYHACIAAGIWADSDLHVSERLWLREQIDADSVPLPPVPIREDRENAFGEPVRQTVGIAAPVVIACGTDEDGRPRRRDLALGEMILNHGEGRWVLVKASDEPLKRILLKTEEWIITDKETASAMAREAQAQHEQEQQAEHDHRKMQQAYREASLAHSPTAAPAGPGMLDGFGSNNQRTHAAGNVPASLSLIPTDPSHGPAGQGGLEKRQEEPPPQNVKGAPEGP